MKRIFSLLLILLCYTQVALAEAQLKAVYPFNMNKQVVKEVREDLQEKLKMQKDCMSLNATDL